MNNDRNKWRFLDSGKGSAIFNMSLDKMLLDFAENASSIRTIRFYSWVPAAISCGYSENAESLIDKELCRRDGIDIVKRPTGGRSVYHSNEIAYSVIANIDDPELGGSIEESSRKIAAILCDGLNQYGIDAELSSGSFDRHSERQVNNPCFLTTSRSEITLGGKKLVGSAQRRLKKAFLQHGSIMTGPGSEKLIDYLLDRRNVDKMHVAFQRKSTDIMSSISLSVDHKRLKNKLLSAFEVCFGVKGQKGTLTPFEIENLNNYLPDDQS